ncbi:MULTISPECIES: ankyrin repeat domain-containing protein [unclassified Iodidimonas]|jgi:ankyrin repeat protein|uniref:ankyrin repeat domain-containing protein n=1 Tax=unclassified Iodidimonas TaxID=2626145 RepID=UPI00248246F9|nr:MULTISPECIES: ankyrin repeat domain-containing protein [unclassified Iodidimonas]
MKWTRKPAIGLFLFMLAAILGSIPAAAQFSAAYELIKAVEDKDYGEMRTQMLKCRCPNVRNVDDIPVLVMAARNSDSKIIEYLLEMGANPDAADRHNRSTALMELARRGNLDGVQMLIQKGADLNAGNSTGQTALMLAAQSRNGRVVSALLEAGADPDMPDYQGQTVFDIARNNRYRDIERLLETAG